MDFVFRIQRCLGWGGGGGRVSKGSGFCIYVLLSFCSSPFCDVLWVVGFPLYKAVLLNGLLFQNLDPFLQQKF